MIVFYSGGSPIPESFLVKPAVMLSYFNNVNQKKHEPDSRMARLLKARKKAKKGAKKCPKSKSPKSPARPKASKNKGGSRSK